MQSCIPADLESPEYPRSLGSQPGPLHRRRGIRASYERQEATQCQHIRHKEAILVKNLIGMRIAHLQIHECGYLAPSLKIALQLKQARANAITSTTTRRLYKVLMSIDANKNAIAAVIAGLTQEHGG